MSFKSGFKCRERESRSLTQQVAVSSKSEVLNDRLANDVRRNGMHISGTDDDRVLRALVRNEMCWLRYCRVLNAYTCCTARLAN